MKDLDALFILKARVLARQCQYIVRTDQANAEGKGLSGVVYEEKKKRIFQCLS